MKTLCLYRLAGVLLGLGGILYLVVQLIHPADELASVGTSVWVLIAAATALMSVLILVGILGTYLRQAPGSGLVGFLGTVLFGLFWLVSMAFSFAEAVILPLLVETSPDFVSGMTGLFRSAPAAVDLGFLPTLAGISGILYIGGGILFGVGTWKAGVLPKDGAILLAAAALATIGASFVPHPLDRIFAVPMGAALIRLGLALALLRPGQVSEAADRQ